jgi:predicted lipoprotein with Yx(FWY)xxD motif
MKNSTAVIWIVVIIIVIVLGGAWWYYYGTGSMTPVPAVTTTTTDTTATPVVSVGTNATLGSILVAANGMTLYTSNADTAGVSNCTGQCLVTWPAYSPWGQAPQVRSRQ